MTGPAVLQLLPQVAIADAACIVALPLVIDPAHAGRAALGGLRGDRLRGAAVLRPAIVRTVRPCGAGCTGCPRSRKFTVELRVSLAILFGLAAIAVGTHVSIMLAGFAFGVVVAAIGEPRRLAKQLFALTEGFLGPLFFVWLGASLDVRDLAEQPSLIGLGLLLGLGALVAHIAMRVTGQPLAIGALACAQLGVPVAAATLATQLNLLGARRGAGPDPGRAGHHRDHGGRGGGRRPRRHNRRSPGDLAYRRTTAGDIASGMKTDGLPVPSAGTCQMSQVVASEPARGSA